MIIDGYEKQEKRIKKYFEKYVNDDNPVLYDYFSFEGDKKTSDYYLSLILEEKKKVMITPLYAYTEEENDMPILNSYSVIMDWEGYPRCIIKTTKVSIIPFNNITKEIVDLEGENTTLEEWKASNEKYYKEDAIEYGYSFSSDMELCVEEFVIIHKD